MSWALTSDERFWSGSGLVASVLRCGLDECPPTYVLENGLHEPDGSLSVLHEFVLGLFDVEPGNE